MNAIQLKMCDIQGRLFELSADKNYGSANFVKVFMNSEVAKTLDSTYNINHLSRWKEELPAEEEMDESSKSALVVGRI